MPPFLRALVMRVAIKYLPSALRHTRGQSAGSNGNCLYALAMSQQNMNEPLPALQMSSAISFAIGRCIFKHLLYMSLGVQPFTLISGGCGQDRSIITLHSWLSFFSLVMSGLTWHQGVDCGESNGPSMAPSFTSFVIYAAISPG